jgi:phage-related protein
VDRPLVILHGEIKSPPFSEQARRWAGFLLRKLQQGSPVSMPDSRPMRSIGKRCHELRVWDAESRVEWRIIYRLDSVEVLIVDVFAKKSQKTPQEAILRCQKRLWLYDQDAKRL